MPLGSNISRQVDGGRALLEMMPGARIELLANLNVKTVVKKMGILGKLGSGTYHRGKRRVPQRIVAGSTRNPQ